MMITSPSGLAVTTASANLTGNTKKPSADGCETMVASPSDSTIISTDLTGDARKYINVGLDTNSYPSGSTFTLLHSDLTGNARKSSEVGLGTSGSTSGSTLTLSDPDLTGNAGKSSAVGT
ncbi:hypothetical protein DPMN_164466 [Dreissena polymorpha]|uniref:Uncharacterized protein n=1 Tax=Dreissena polymorpha TaxID=45954 RepID=A0A9D4EVA3_DREPO|nr:hypothetical protein DPMN_164466 [Dreissena polymorpha]